MQALHKTFVRSVQETDKLLTHLVEVEAPLPSRDVAMAAAAGAAGSGSEVAIAKWPLLPPAPASGGSAEAAVATTAAVPHFGTKTAAMSYGLPNHSLWIILSNIAVGAWRRVFEV